MVVEAQPLLGRGLRAGADASDVVGSRWEVGEAPEPDAVAPDRGHHLAGQVADAALPDDEARVEQALVVGGGVVGRGAVAADLGEPAPGRRGEGGESVAEEGRVAPRVVQGLGDLGLAPPGAIEPLGLGHPPQLVDGHRAREPRDRLTAADLGRPVSGQRLGEAEGVAVGPREPELGEHVEGTPDEGGIGVEQGGDRVVGGAVAQDAERAADLDGVRVEAVYRERQ